MEEEEEEEEEIRCQMVIQLDKDKKRYVRNAIFDCLFRFISERDRWLRSIKRHLSSRDRVLIDEDVGVLATIDIRG